MVLDQKTGEADRVYEEFEPPIDWDHDEGSDTLILTLPGTYNSFGFCLCPFLNYNNSIYKPKLITYNTSLFFFTSIKHFSF